MLQAGPAGSLLWDLGVLGRFLVLGLACSTFDQYDSVRAMAPFATWSVQQVHAATHTLASACCRCCERYSTNL